MELNPFSIRGVLILVVKIDPTRRMEYQKHFLERRHTEMYTWSRNCRIDNLDDWFNYCGYAWLCLMLVQLLRLIPERFLTFSQHAQGWIFGVWVRLRKHYVALLVLVSNLKEDQSAVALVVHQALEMVSAAHCQERNEINNHRKENRHWHSREFFLLSTTISSSRIWNKSSTSQTSLLKKMIFLTDHRLEKSSDECTESILWLYLFFDRIISSAKLVHIYCITYLYVAAPNLPHSSVYCWL